MVYFEIFPWNKNFETGIEKIDEQHKQLVHILNQLAAHLANRSDALQLNDIFDELAAYADYHFKTEEAVWSHHFASDEWATGHEQTHGSFIEQVVAIKNNEGKKPLDDVVYEIVTFLSKWLAYHILDTDKRMAIAVLKMDAGMPLEEAKHAATEEMGGAMKVIVDTVLNMYESLSTRTLDLMREKSLRLQAEAALEQSEERWRFIVESGSDNVWDWDIEHNTLKRSEQNPSLFEIADKHVRSAHKEVKVHPGDIAQINADFQAHLDGKTDFYVNKHRILQQNGSWSWVLSRGKVIERDEAGRPLRMVGTHTDITEREFASLIHKNSTQAIFISDEENHIVSVNPAFSDITGYSEAEAIGQNPRFLASGIHDDAYYAAMWERLGAKGMWKGKITNRRKEGGLYTEWLEIHAVRNPQGEIDHYIAMFNDITKEEAHEKEQAVQREYLLQQSRMAQMGELISMIAHQWRQPLNIIASMSAALQTKLAVNKFDLALESGREAFKSFFDKKLKDIDAHVANLTVTMDDFRNFYNPNKQSSMLSIESPVKKALSIIRASLTSHDIVIEEKYEDTQPVEMHENEIIQVILNVLKNAQDNFKEKKTPSPKIVISTKRMEASTLLQICDNGGGIPADIMERIFEPYFSTKSEHMGTGLGLHMSRMIMESHHNGRFYAGNTADGVCFTIELSLAGDAE